MKAVGFLLMVAIRAYRCVLSPMKAALFGPLGRCRFTPSCSEYALEAVRLHGAVRGTWLATRRLCRCHPWGGCGEDPVPKSEVQSPKSKVRAAAGTDPRRRAALAPGTFS